MSYVYVNGQVKLSDREHAWTDKKHGTVHAIVDLGLVEIVFDSADEARQVAARCLKAAGAIDSLAGVVTEKPAAALTPGQIRTVLSALDVAADAKRDAADVCPDCDTRPDGALCGTCEWRLAVADEYDALAEKLRERL
jgi:hypothetical protein